MVPYSKIHSKVSLSHEIPPHLRVLSIDGSKKLYGQSNTSEILVQSLTLPEYSMQFVKLIALGNETIMLAREQPAYFLVIQLQNTLHFSLPGLPGLRLLEWSFNLYYTSRFELEVIMKKDWQYETFYLVVPEAFIQYFSKQYETLWNFHTKTKDEAPRSLFPFPKTCPPEIIQSIISVKQKGMGELGLGFAEDLLTSIFQTADSLPYRRINYTDEVIERLYALRIFLQQHLETNFTKDELMQRFQLSTHQFNKGFSSIYSLTPFSLLKFLKHRED